MVTYIKYSVRNYYLNVENDLDPTLYSIGTTYDDFMNNKFVKLSDKQIAFHEEHPDATLYEVWHMALRTKTLDEVKVSKIRDIDDYDTSSSVNGFYYNEKLHWIDKATRVSVMNSINILKQLGEETATIWFDDECITLPCDTALNMLYQIEMYALKCYNVTARHKVHVNNLTTIEEVEAFNIKSDYPAQIRFTSSESTSSESATE